jgi:hypothetical protein
LIWFSHEPACPVEDLSVKEEGAVMRKQQILRIFAAGLAATIAGGTAVAQEYRGTMQEQMACTPDVFRLCGAAIPDATRIVACLQANTMQLSAPCRSVFESNDSAANSPPQPVTPPVRRGYPYQ